MLVASLPTQVVEERCVYRVNSDNSGWTEIRREAWVSSSLFGVSRAVQVSNVVGFLGPGAVGMEAEQGSVDSYQSFPPQSFARNLVSPGSKAM